MQVEFAVKSKDLRRLAEPAIKGDHPVPALRVGQPTTPAGVTLEGTELAGGLRRLRVAASGEPRFAVGSAHPPLDQDMPVRDVANPARLQADGLVRRDPDPRFDGTRSDVPARADPKQFPGLSPEHAQ